MGVTETNNLSIWLDKVNALVEEAGDLRSLYPAQKSAPDLRLTNSAFADIFHYYGIPMWSTVGTDAFRLDAQAAMEHAFGTLLAALDILAAAGRPVRAVIAGDGPQRPAVEKFIAQSPAGKYARMLGMVSDVPAVDSVEAGQVLLTLDTQEVNDNLASVEAEIAKAQADLGANEATVVSLRESAAYGQREARRDQTLLDQNDIPASAAEGSADKARVAQARLEAMRCLQCRNAPCVGGCPVRIDIPAFVGAIADGDYAQAISIIKRNSLLPAVCGRVCPQETQCQAPCTVGKMLKDETKSVAIGRLERFVADWEREQGLIEIPAVKPETGKKVGIIGTGPAGLTVAADVRREGHAVTLFEAFHKPGGVMVYGIPEFRLPKAIVQKEIDTLTAMGCELQTNFVIGRTRKITDLLEQDGFDALFIATGAGLYISKIPDPTSLFVK